MRQYISYVLLIGLLLSGRQAAGHGSVTDGEDGCMIRMNFYSAHFTVFQPQTRGHREYCEDLPDLGESVFVMEYLHDSLRQVPIDFRIIRNTTPVGRFVRWSDVEALGDLTELTVFYQRVMPQPDGVLTVLHNFTQPGDYVGVVSAPHPSQSDNIYHAVFAFSVGKRSIPGGFWLPAGVLLAGLIVWRRRAMRRQA